MCLCLHSLLRHTRTTYTQVPSLVKQDKVQRTWVVASAVLTITAFVVGVVRSSSLYAQYLHSVCTFTGLPQLCPAGNNNIGSAGGSSNDADDAAASLVSWGDLILMRPVCVLLCLVPISLPLRYVQQRKN